MKRTRRIGSITLGITLLVSGVMFLLQMVLPALDYYVIFKFWPIVLIILGLEILFENVASRLQKDEECVYKYDVAAIFMIMATGAFAMCMAGVDILIRQGCIHFN